jgi:hypothetical protein
MSLVQRQLTRAPSSNAEPQDAIKQIMISFRLTSPLSFSNEYTK